MTSTIKWLNEYRTAAMFLTRLPLSNDDGAITKNWAKCYWAFPIVGVATAGVPAIIMAIAAQFGLPLLASAVIMMAAVMVITGGLHHDGLADCADSFGGNTPKQRLDIMHDSRIGSFGSLALITAAIINAACLAKIGADDPWKMAAAFIAAATLSRAMMAMQRWHRPPPNSTKGLAASTGKPPLAVVIVSVLIGIGIAAAFLPQNAAMIAVLAAAITTRLFGACMQRWIGGINGDGLGATQQLSEVVIIISAAMAMS